MRYLVLICICFLSNSLALSAQKLFPDNIYEFVENPEVTHINQSEAGSLLVPYGDVNAALSGEKSKQFLSLNGAWKFSWSERYETSVKRFYKADFDDKRWATISVPGNWEMQGYGDYMFRNIQHPFTINPPFVPRDYNPVGEYRKSFKLPQSWNGKEIFLTLEAASSVSFVWVNGHEAGYNAGAFEPSRYNITPFLKSGNNTISVLVFKYSAGTYLEDQDYWRLSGIFRDVYLTATPKTYIEDVHVITDLDGSYKDALLQISTTVNNRPKAQFRIEASLLDRDRRQICSQSSQTCSDENGTIKLESNIENPAKWSAETPNLYTLVVKLFDGSGRLTEVVSKKVGFREMEIKAQALYLNGAPIKLNGVNSHMQHPVLGHAMDMETMRKDLILMKRFNINCVRTSHYPPNKEYLELADELGMYVVDEVGDESHATEYLSEDPTWRAAYVNRARRTVLRDRSHPCIIFWSAGNESGFGQNISEVIREGKSLDPTRVWMYGGNTDDPAWANEVPDEDIIGPRYPTPVELKYRIAIVPESQDPRPSFMDEYIAATGNGMGGLDDYWDIIWQYPRCIGGAIWDWVSPGLTEKVRLLKDDSPNGIVTSINSRGKIVEGFSRSAIQLSGFDQWVDIYRHPALDIESDEVTLAMTLNPQTWNGNGDLLTKGSYQYGLVQSHADSISFYVGTKRVGRLTVAVPGNWYGQWHKLAAVYDGRSMSIYIDGRQVAQKPHSGKIINRPFPVNLGRNAEHEGQAYGDRHSNAIIDQVRIFDKAITAEQLAGLDSELKNEAQLWLDFDSVQEQGEYFTLGNDARSYGLVFPDREVQPELWQVKKSAQPILAHQLDIETRRLNIINRHRFTNLDRFRTLWYLYADGEVLQQGELMLSAAPMDTITTTLPFSMPKTEQGKEYRLVVSFVTKEESAWSEKGFEVAWNEFMLPYTAEPVAIESAQGDISAVEHSDKLTVAGDGFEYLFDIPSCKLTSLKYHGTELIEHGAQLNVWRAPLANELDAWGLTGANLKLAEGMGHDAANAWRSLGLDKLTYRPEKLSYHKTQDNTVVVEIKNYCEGIDYRTIFEEQYRYTITPQGEITVDHSIRPQGFMPAWIPCIGNTWELPKEFTQVEWYGRGPYENYPDRKSGAKVGLYRSDIDKMQEHYLIPQDYALRCDNRRVCFENAQGVGIEFSSDKLFDFNAYPYTTDNLSRARYPFQLTRSGAITFNFNYATTGIGCTSTSVLNQYRVLPQQTVAQFKIRPYSNQIKQIK